MQNRYVADVGDFGKFALLSALASRGFRLGVQWYLNHSTEPNQDGRLTQYPALRDCDPDLYDKLRRILQSGERTVATLECAQILPTATQYYAKEIPRSVGSCFSDAARNARRDCREEWFNEGVLALKDADLV